MVLMEYMACGKPVVASYNSGHKDVVDNQCAVLIENHQPLKITYHDEGRSATWFQPNLDETIEKLEWCYQNRDRLPELGRRANERMKPFTWRRVAQGLLDCARTGH